MSVKTPAADERTDPRPTYFALGVDETGAHHTYCTRTDTVHVVDGGDRTHAQPLGEKTIGEWMGFVDGKRGWGSRRYGRSLAELITDGLEGGDE